MSLKHAVLGFLSIAPMTGYDLRKHMEESVAHFWPADQAQIYRTLGHLAADGLVSVETIPQEGKPDRREHSITDAGLAELDAWLASPVEYAPSREAFLVRLFFVGRLGVDQVRAVLQERADEARELAAVLDQTRTATEEALTDVEPNLEMRLRLATLANGLVHARAELAWAQDLLTDLTDLTD
ncbi:PadR family transcriptional regulator [Cellulomonas fengjieae]|uniref:PadR family transcriptional regulator n=2 Tax=Cellulomonas fengjieae TaxID=2819978 RepID=A0ABS3SK09_9CELL|nr:PadR family transcriptional regulator [Cellulomonas fengjieae]MBO3085997.1 PadR family transcriptional regulator [Cellulomonas fengjieae]QVI65933.1 PadR family transcriptional regulator [Cellulomonas fengjieae]